MRLPTYLPYCPRLCHTGDDRSLSWHHVSHTYACRSRHNPQLVYTILLDKDLFQSDALFSVAPKSVHAIRAVRPRIHSFYLFCGLSVSSLTSQLLIYFERRLDTLTDHGTQNLSVGSVHDMIVAGLRVLPTDLFDVRHSVLATHSR